MQGKGIVSVYFETALNNTAATIGDILIANANANANAMVAFIATLSMQLYTWNTSGEIMEQNNNSNT